MNTTPRIRTHMPRLALACLLLAAGCGWTGERTPTTNEILWDRYGVPHIYATDHESLFRGFGWAQAHAHGDLLLRLIGQARGRAGEYWGEAELARDRMAWTLGTPRTGERAYHAADPEMRRWVDAFANGINAYAEEHPDRIAAEVAAVLPVEGADAYRMFAALAAFFSRAEAAVQPWQRGSNAWAVAPSRTATGNAMLLANPHLPWFDNLTWIEAHLVGPGIDLHGAALIGLPILGIAFNDRLGWTHTVNTVLTEDIYELTLAPGGYRWDGEIRAFEVDTLVLLVRGAEATAVASTPVGDTADGPATGAVGAAPLRSDTLFVQRSVHGPVIAMRADRALALRSVLEFTGDRAFEQWWAMANARGIDDFVDALRMNQVPGFTTTYADRDGNIMHDYGGATAIRPHGDYAYWAGIVPGDVSANLWTDLHPWEDMPRAVNPPAGWVQNANEPSWFATFPQEIHPADFPPYFGPELLPFRTRESIRLLQENEGITLDDLVRMKFSTRVALADRILPELIVAGRARGGLAAEAAEVLERWDRETNADSRGAVLFQAWAQRAAPMHGGSIFATPFSREDPLNTPAGLRDPGLAAQALEAAAEMVETRAGSLDVAWGDVNRLRRGDADYPGIGDDGRLGTFTVIGYQPTESGVAVSLGGDSYIAAVEFGRPLRARTLLVHGNSTQPGSPHQGDQIGYFAGKELRPVWRTRREIEANLSERTVF